MLYAALILFRRSENNDKNRSSASRDDESFKEGNTKRKEALSLLLAALKAKFIDKRAELTESEENAIIQKEIKQVKETMQSAPQDRQDIIEECEIKIETFSEFAPTLMSEAEIKAELENVLNELNLKEPTAKDKGVIMKKLMPILKGKADSALINKAVEDLFSIK